MECSATAATAAMTRKPHSFAASSISTRVSSYARFPYTQTRVHLAPLPAICFKRSIATAGARPPKEGMAIKTISSGEISHWVKSVFASLRSILTGFSLHCRPRRWAAFSVPPVGLKMISTVFISIASCYCILFRISAMQSANVFSARE